MSTDHGDNQATVRRHHLLADMAEKAALHLIKVHGLDEEKACDVGNELADFLAKNWRGQHIYFNADTQFYLSKRDHEIYQRMERGNAYELAKEYDLSYVRIYQIYKRVLAEMRARNQPGLFEEVHLIEAKLSTGSGEGN
ncbi:MAG: Mor transcription activator family protein [Rubrivivax sp.]|nr:Mor transcription activator family protein [Rubrivivax sp.]